MRAYLVFVVLLALLGYGGYVLAKRPRVERVMPASQAPSPRPH